MKYKLVVCGAGTMGRGIAQNAAQQGFKVVLFDVKEAATDHARERIDADLEKLLQKGKITAADKSRYLSNLSFSSDKNDCRGDIIIEAIVEIADIKIDLFRSLSEINPPETIFATNTSSISVEQIASGVPHPERVAGMHFFNPATIMKLVEVVAAPQTSKEVIATLVEVAEKMQKVPVVCKDAPGFIVNHVARPFYIESLYLHQSGVSIELIDELLEQTGFKMGPFKLMDLIGNDINYAVSKIVYEQLGHPARLEPSVIQKEMVEKGDLGRKTGKGYYQYI